MQESRTAARMTEIFGNFLFLGLFDCFGHSLLKGTSCLQRLYRIYYPNHLVAGRREFEAIKLRPGVVLNGSL